MHRLRRSLSTALLSALVPVAVGVHPLARAQVPTECFNPGASHPEIYGPTDISAASGNRGLSVALNRKATVTVFKWPSPSFYDQIKYRTKDRTQPRMGALRNEGAFLGVAHRGSGQRRWRFSWLRTLPSRQRFADDDTDEVVTVFTKKKAGLKVTVRDVVAPRSDVFVRKVTVARKKDSRIRSARVFAFANFNPVFSKRAQAPVDDWCFEDSNDDGARFDSDRDAIVHARAGIDESTGQPSSVAVAMGFAGGSDGHQVGVDTYETGATGQSAFDDAFDGRLEGRQMAPGQVDVALFDTLRLKRRKASATLAMAAAPTADAALDVLDDARDRRYGSIRRAKKAWWKNWLRSAPLPRNAPRAVTRLSKRALISLRQAMDAGVAEHQPEGKIVAPGGLIVASIATQSPYGEDWIRDGAYFNRVLDIAGKHQAVAQHNFRYALLQHSTGDTTRGGQPIPPGNWAMNYYADGVVGGPIPYEIDETGYGMWTLWDHYEQTRDRDYLLVDHGGIVYKAIERSAQYLTDVCRDPANGLQCVANEDDNPNPTQTLYGALLVWLGLDSAVKAAVVKGSVEALANADRWAQRRDEIRDAIEQQFFDDACGCYTNDFGRGGTLLWPVALVPHDSQKALDQADANWRSVRDSFNGKRARGQYEAKALLGNAYVWDGMPAKEALLEDGLLWLARKAATDETHLLGEAWMRFPTPDDPVTAMVSQPHVWQQVLFYLTALQLYGEAPYTFR